MPARQRSTSWDDIGWTTTDTGARYSTISMSLEEGDDVAPVVYRIEYPPGAEVAPHKHEADYFETVLAGSVKVGKTWYEAGDVRIVRGGTGYGPLSVGPDGVSLLVMFRDPRSAVVPVGRA